jgi:hypothetical protein
VKRKKSDQAQYVGIFWLVHGKLVIDSTPLREAEPYGDSLTHPRSHIDVWAQFQRIGKVPPESEYEEYPRGRVMHHPKSGEFTILTDPCILARKDLITQIKDALHLPKQTALDTDPHYRCWSCLYGKQIDDEDED